MYYKKVDIQQKKIEDNIKGSEKIIDDDNNIISDNNGEIKEEKNNYKIINETKNKNQDNNKKEEENYNNLSSNENINDEKNSKKEINIIANNLDENNIIDKNKNENNNSIRPSSSHYSYISSNYKSLINNDFNLSDKFLLEKYNNNNYNKYYNYSFKKYLNKNIGCNNYYQNNISYKNKNDCNLNLNNDYLYNIPKVFPSNADNLLKNTSLENYHIPHTQSSMKKGPGYSIYRFDLDRNKKNYDDSLIDKANNYIFSFNREKYSNSNCINNSLIYDYDNKRNYKNICNYNIKNEYQKTNELFEPYKYNSTFNKNLNFNELIDEDKNKIYYRNNNNNKIIRTSPTDFYYNTIHEINTQNIPLKYKTYFPRTYQINSKYEYRNNNLVSNSSIIRNLIYKNKNKYL